MENKVLIIDPNAASINGFGGVVTPEQLTISVELKAIKKDRSAIAISNGKATVKTGSNAAPISFLGGSNVGNGDGKNSLTTHFTELGSNFNVGEKDLETLGIKDIQIEFNSACAPLISINFVDVRGKLFEMGKDSPYSVFWELPYPIFELTVKGYYGKAVTYKLHLTKFNGSFDYSTGNFEIQCNFIGYTYAFLSDVIMGHLKGIPYTTRGKVKIAEKLREKDQGIHQFYSFNELNEVIKNVSNVVDAMKQDNEALKAVKKADEVVLQLDTLKKSLLSSVAPIGNRINDDRVQGFYAYKPTTTETQPLFQTDVDNFNKSMTEKLKELNGEGGLDNGYKLTENNFLIKKGETWFEDIRRSDFEQDYQTYNETLAGEVRYVRELEDQDKFDAFKRGVFAVNNISGSSFTVITIQDALKEITKLIDRISAEREEKFLELGNELIGSKVFNLKGKQFQPTIGNIVNLVCDHVDIFMDCIRDVAVEAEKDPRQRERDLKNITGILDEADDSNLGNLKAFPTYSEMIDGVYVDKWIGNVAPDIPEVIFIEELLEGIIKASQDDVKTFEGLGINSQGKPQWFPVNTFDSPIFGVTNAYDKLSDEAKLEDYLRLIVLRAMVYFYSSSNTNVTDVKNMARMEANNVLNSMVNADIKNALRVYAENSGKATLLTDAQAGVKFKNYQLDGTYTQSAAGIDKSAIIETNVTSYDTVGGVGSSQGPSTVTTTVSAYTYTYTPIISGSVLNYSNTFLPLTVNGFKDYNTDFLVKKGGVITSNAERKSLRDSGVIFFTSNAIGQTIDDGSTSLKILKGRKSILNKVYFPSYGDGVMDMEPKTVNLDQPNIDAGPSNMFLQGSSGSYTDVSVGLFFYDKENEFFRPNNYKKDSRYAPFDSINNKLYLDNNKGAFLENDYNTNTFHSFSNRSTGCISLREGLGRGSDNYYVPHLGFKSAMFIDDAYYSLFGSYLYNSQTDGKAKAYLFLHSLPFANLVDGQLFDHARIAKLFKQKGGFVEVPYAWALFVGAALSRRAGRTNVVYGDSTMSYVRHLEKDAYPTASQYTVSTSMTTGGWFNFNDDGYETVDPEFLNLPIGAQNEFINLFETWVSKEYAPMARDLEIFQVGTSQTQIRNFWQTFNILIKSSPDLVYQNPILKPDLRKNYAMFLRISDEYSDNASIPYILNDIQNEDSGAPFNFLLELRQGSPAAKKVMEFLTQTRIIATSSHRIWGNSVGSLNSDPIIKANKTNFDAYVDSFFSEYLKLTKNLEFTVVEEEKAVREQIFQTINNDDIKLNLYVKVKSLYDKWICGSDEKYLDNTNELYNSFRFIDRAYKNIEDDFKVNIIPMVAQITENYNQSFYNYLARILGDNNFDFFPMPSFINYQKPDEVMDMFKPYTYNNMETSVKPQFVCMYIGEKSNALGESINFRNNSFNFNDNTLPSDFQSGTGVTPIFLVQYGVQDQSVFKDLKLTQSEFTATDESLTITDAISKQSNTSTSMGQNLFDVYINRSYTCHVEMLGNVMIQPLMYFQLDNVPMFRGAYTIIKVTHHIKPNTMTTNFTGVRMRLNKTKMIDEAIIIKNILGDISDVSSDGANLNNLGRARYSRFITYKLDSNKNNGLVKQSEGVKNYCIKEIGQFIEQVAKKWHSMSINQPYSDTLYYNDLSKMYGGDIAYHESHEEGTSFDFRMMTSDKQVRTVTINDAHYDREATKKLLQLFIDSQRNFKGWTNNKIIKAVYTQDQQLINHFSSSGIPFKAVPNHSNHIHIEFYAPENVVTGELTETVPTETGQLAFVDKSAIPTRAEMINYLGLIA